MKSVRWYHGDKESSFEREQKFILKCTCRATVLDASLSFLSTSRRYSRKRSPILLAVSPIYIFLHKVHNYAIDNICEIKRSVILIDRLGPVILCTLPMKGQVLHRLRAYLSYTGQLATPRGMLNESIFRATSYKMYLATCMLQETIFSATSTRNISRIQATRVQAM